MSALEPDAAQRLSAKCPLRRVTLITTPIRMTDTLNVPLQGDRRATNRAPSTRRTTEPHDAPHCPLGRVYAAVV
jgi:hypothetical protein